MVLWSLRFPWLTDYLHWSPPTLQNSCFSRSHHTEFIVTPGVQSPVTFPSPIQYNLSTPTSWVSLYYVFQLILQPLSLPFAWKNSSKSTNGLLFQAQLGKSIEKLIHELMIVLTTMRSSNADLGESAFWFVWGKWVGRWFGRDSVLEAIERIFCGSRSSVVAYVENLLRSKK